MAVVALVALLSGFAVLSWPLFQPAASNAFDAVEMVGPDPPEPERSPE
jgi:hypothetical protein